MNQSKICETLQPDPQGQLTRGDFQRELQQAHPLHSPLPPEPLLHPGLTPTHPEKGIHIQFVGV